MLTASVWVTDRVWKLLRMRGETEVTPLPLHMGSQHPHSSFRILLVLFVP